ncbi:MAG: GTPase domain-containing protein [Pseudomonadota bacterium]|jgi:hypothetical protein|nr:GTPase domain-containing protein [Pseudomonadota bacterium]
MQPEPPKPPGTGREIALSLVSHTNAGKTTLARTLLAADIGIVRDEAHVTDEARGYLLARTPEGDELRLWDTPGFGDSHRLARRLERSDNPFGWLLGQVWDRLRDRPLYSSQQAIRNVREQADVVLYLVNAAEDPLEAGYVEPEMRILDWIGKPVIVLLNQTGRPRPPEEEAAELARWRAATASSSAVREVIQLDAFARCWVQESTLLAAVGRQLPDAMRPAFDRLQTHWMAVRRARFDASMAELARRIARAAHDRETVADDGIAGRILDAGILPGRRRPERAGPRERAMRALAERLDADIRASVDELIRIHELSGRAGAVVMQRLAEHYAVTRPLSEGKAAVWGGLVTGALAGLKADLATGGLTLGGGLIAGGVIGALGAAGLARGYNMARGGDQTVITWADAILEDLVVSALLSYLAVAHYGRGRGQWSESEHPPHWEETIRKAMAARGREIPKLLADRRESATIEALAAGLAPEIAALGLDVLGRLYPDAPSLADRSAAT